MVSQSAEPNPIFLPQGPKSERENLIVNPRCETSGRICAPEGHLKLAQRFQRR